MQDITPDLHDIAARHDFLEITAIDIDVLREIHSELELHKHVLSNEFYDHLKKFPATNVFLKDAENVERLKRTQSTYFNSLTCGDYGVEYVKNRLRVGLVHHHIGLNTEWYVGAYRKYISELIPIIKEICAGDTERFYSSLQSIIKIINFDIGLAMDAYLYSDRKQILYLKQYSEQIIGNMPSGIMVIDQNSKIRTMNQAAKKMFDLEDVSIPENCRFYTVITNSSLCSCIEQCLSGHDYKTDIVISMTTASMLDIYLRCTFARTRLDGQNLLIVMFENITIRTQARIELRESEERFRATFAQATVGLAHIGVDGRWLRVNLKLQEILGYSESELLKQTIWDVTPDTEIQNDRLILKSILATEDQSYSTEKHYRHKNGHMVNVNVSFSVMQSDQEKKRFIVVIEDISQRKQFEEKLVKLAHHDSLTGLSNRALLLDRLTQAITYANRSKKFVAVLFIDLDRFKNINDSLGHDVGDQVIVEVGQRLLHTIREGDTVARFGGDEFVVVLSDIAREDEVGQVAQKILTALFAPMLVSGHELTPVGSIGISIYPQDGADSSTLIKNADTAMYTAKGMGRNNFQFYALEMNARTLDRLTLESGLRHALERNEFELVYQPQLDVSTSEIVGVEALLRWHPHGMPIVMPGEFISILEETGLIIPIGEWVLRTACAQQVAWRNSGLREIRMSVNLSACQFKQKNLEQMVMQILTETGCCARFLDLEITESVVMENPETASATLKNLSAMGVQLSIDDFGTGYSSLSYLKRFPIHTLKIDKSFVQDITTNASDAAISKAVIALAKGLEIKVVAEGVETVEQLNFLRQQECVLMQGYFFCRPLPAEQCRELLERADPFSLRDA